MRHHKLHEQMQEQGAENALLPEIDALLNKDPNDTEALFLIGQFFVRSENYPMAHLAFQRINQLAAPNPAVLNNIGTALVCMNRHKEAMSYYQQALRKDRVNAGALAGMALIFSETCEFERAERYATRSLEQRDAVEPKVTRGFARLALGDWEKGWQDYHEALKTKHRARIDYGLPDWTGEEHPATVIVHGEQGLGDEILFSRYLPVLHERGIEVIVDCDHRLKMLFRRSFPFVTVFGDRRAEQRPWLADSGATHQIPIGELPRLLALPAPERLGAYLTPDPLLKLMYRALVGSGKRIGVCWSGGTKGTGRDKRTLPDDALVLLTDYLGRNDARLFSLEYDPEQALRGVPLGVTHHNFAVGRGASYDHTAAFIANMDVIVGTDTTAHHIAGAMGVPSVMLVHDKPLWINSEIHGTEHPWYESVRYARKKASETWNAAIRRMIGAGVLDV